MFILNSNDTAPLYKQLYNQIREHVLSGKLPANSRLPSVRDNQNSKISVLLLGAGLNIFLGADADEFSCCSKFVLEYNNLNKRSTNFH